MSRVLPKKAAPVPPVRLAGRPHQVGITSTKPKVRYQLSEVESGELRSVGILGPADKEVIINVKGAAELHATAVEALQVRIDGRRFQLPPGAVGEVPVIFPDLETAPPPAPPPPAAAKDRRKR